MGYTILQTGNLVVLPVPRMDISNMCTIGLVIWRMLFFPVRQAGHEYHFIRFNVYTFLIVFSTPIFARDPN
jgi:hypothetical protein